MQFLRALAIALFALCFIAAVDAKLAERECEVCIKVLGDLDLKTHNTLEKGEAHFRSHCKKLDGVERRFCYYIGATEDAATSIVQQAIKPMLNHKPSTKVCEDLKKKDSQICQLRFEAKMDLSKVEVSKLKIGDLKKVIRDENLDCSDCSEKGDYVRVVQAFKDSQAKASPKKEL